MAQELTHHPIIFTGYPKRKIITACNLDLSDKEYLEARKLAPKRWNRVNCPKCHNWKHKKEIEKTKSMIKTREERIVMTHRQLDELRGKLEALLQNPEGI